MNIREFVEMTKNIPYPTFVVTTPPKDERIASTGVYVIYIGDKFYCAYTAEDYSTAFVEVEVYPRNLTFVGYRSIHEVDKISYTP